MKLLRASYNRLKDWVAWEYRWKNEGRRELTVASFLRLIAEPKLDDYRLQLIRWIREKNALISSEEVEQCVADLAHAIEAEQWLRSDGASREDRTNTNEYGLSVSGPEILKARYSKVFTEWYETFRCPGQFRLGSWGPDILDEISILLDEIRAKRRAAGA